MVLEADRNIHLGPTSLNKGYVEQGPLPRDDQDRATNPLERPPAAW